MHKHNPNFIFRNGHISTILGKLLKTKTILNYTRERIELDDGDFVDIDHVQKGRNKLAIMVHGLEGSSDSYYLHSLGGALLKEDYDIMAINFRSCSGELNRTKILYHSGFIIDLKHLVERESLIRDEIVLIGFSLGGNMLLKYAGEMADEIPLCIKRVIAVSAPIHLSSSCKKLLHSNNRFYNKHFLSSLRKKIIEKSNQYPELLEKIKVNGLSKIKSIYEFDDKITSVLHGFKDAEDYYLNCSALYVLDNIKCPFTIISAKDDPFLSKSCFPENLVTTLENMQLIITRYGGHVSFVESIFRKNWLETKVIEILN